MSESLPTPATGPHSEQSFCVGGLWTRMYFLVALVVPLTLAGGYLLGIKLGKQGRIREASDAASVPGWS